MTRKLSIALALLGAWLLSVSQAWATPVSLVARDLAGVTVAYQVLPSADGQRVLIRGTDGGQPALWSVRVADGTALRLTPESEFVTNVAQSPDGQLVAWSTEETEPYAVPALYVHDLGSGATRRLGMPAAFGHRCPSRAGRRELCVGGDVKAIYIGDTGRVSALIDDTNTHGGALVVTAAAGAPRMAVVPDPVLRHARRHRLLVNSSHGEMSAGGGVFAICRYILRRDGSQAPGGLVVTDVRHGLRVRHAMAGVVDSDSCLASDSGVGLASSTHGKRRTATIVGRGRPWRVALGKLRPLSISPNGRWIVAGARHSLRVFDAKSRHKRRLIRLGGAWGSPVEWSPDDRHVTLDGHAIADLRRSVARRLAVRDADTACFTANGRVLVARETDRPVEQAADLFLADTAGANPVEISGSADLTPLLWPPDCSGFELSRGVREVFFVAGSDPSLYSVAADELDGSRLTAPGE